MGIGSMIIPHIEGNNEYFLSSGTIKSFDLSEAELRRFLETETTPVLFDRSLLWSDQLDIGVL